MVFRTQLKMKEGEEMSKWRITANYAARDKYHTPYGTVNFVPVAETDNDDIAEHFRNDGLTFDYGTPNTN